MGYFVKQAELEAKKKGSAIAGLLSILLGAVGLHRFYLGRNTSGWLILLSTIITAGAAMFFWVPWTVIEGIMLLSLRKSKPTQPQTSYVEGITDENIGDEPLNATKHSYAVDQIDATAAVGPQSRILISDIRRTASSGNLGNKGSPQETDKIAR